MVYIVKSGGAGWDKRREQKMPVSFVFAFAGRQAGIKGRSKKCLLVLCLCTVIEIRRRNKKLELGLCTVVYIVKPGGWFREDVHYYLDN